MSLCMWSPRYVSREIFNGNHYSLQPCFYRPCPISDTVTVLSHSNISMLSVLWLCRSDDRRNGCSDIGADSSVAVALIALTNITTCDIRDCTSSSAIAERPRDASCLSVVSFNSTIPLAQSFIISYFDFRFNNANNSTLFCVSVFCHKRDSLMRGAAAFVDSERRTTCQCYMLFILHSRNIDDTRWSSSDRCRSQILVENHEFCPS